MTTSKNGVVGGVASRNRLRAILGALQRSRPAPFAAPAPLHPTAD